VLPQGVLRIRIWATRMSQQTVCSPHADEKLTSSLAVLEMKMVFAGILLKYDLDFADGPMDPMDDLWAQVTPLKLRITNITTTTTTTTAH